MCTYVNFNFTYIHVCTLLLCNLGCGGGCIAGSTIGGIFATGIAVTVTMLIITFTRKRKKKVIAIMNFNASYI